VCVCKTEEGRVAGGNSHTKSGINNNNINNSSSNNKSDEY
jgi:hypothetical protein